MLQGAKGQSTWGEEEKRRMHHVGHTQAQNVEEGNAIIVSNAAPLFLSPSLNVSHSLKGFQ